MLDKLRGKAAGRLVPARQVQAVLGQRRDVRQRLAAFGGYRFILCLWAVCAFYYAFVASDRYVTETQVYVREARESVPTLQPLSLLGGGGGAQQDALLVREFIHSRDMLNLLESTIGLKAHFASRDWDIISRMGGAVTAEEFLTDFRSRVELNLDPESSILTIRAEGYTPEFSETFANAILREAEAFINRVGQSIAEQEIGFVQGELNRAQDALADAQNELLTFQNENRLLDPTVTTAARQDVVNTMEGELAQMQAERRTLESYLNPAAPELVALKDRIAAVLAQLDEERAKLAGSEGETLNETSMHYQAVQRQVQFAADLYQSTLVALEQARVEAYRKLKHLVVVQAPQRPDDALYPRAFYNLATLFIVMSLAYGIIMMVVATIREHRDV